MGIADFFRPKYRHSDVKVRSEAVRALTADDAAIIQQIARTDRDIGIRRIAIEKIDEADVLAELGREETERSLRELITKRAAELWISGACNEDADKAGAALGGIIKLGDQRALVDVVVRAHNAGIRKRAFGEMRDPRALAELAKSNAPQDLRLAAIALIDDGDVLRALAIDTTQKEVGLAAVEKIDDVDRLENIAAKAKNKAIQKKARKIVGEIQDAERAQQKPATPDEVKRRRAEKAQLLRKVEAIADTFDFAKMSGEVSAAEVAWMKLGGDDDGDDRFDKAVERFWKRKEVHDSTARTPDELRAIEAEARREKEHAAAERAPKKRERERDPDDVDVVREPEKDEKREAREAEAKARREEREQQRVEEEARKQAQAAEREARKKEDAERGAAIAASLEAMVGEMEALVDSKDGKVIDRVLSQSAKAFENIGKVQGAQRDQLADRYSAARGKLVIKANERREAEDWVRWANVPKAEALIETAKLLVAAEAPPDLGNRLRDLQALWKEVGPMPQRRSKELWETFKAECDKIYDKVKGVRAVENEKFAEVTKVKEGLIAAAEQLADSTDFAATADKLKELQAQWKVSGHLPRKQGDELWKRFRSACDRFFERRKPMIDAKRAEEGENLARKQALITRAQQIANKAGEGTWGKAIGEIKDLQREWKDIGHVPRRDAEAVWQAFRGACDSLFTKRDASRDAEANAHRAEVEAIKAEIFAVLAGGDDVAARGIAVRNKARELGVLGAECVEMVQHLIATHANAIKGTELDPAQLRAKRDKLIARAEELLPKQPEAVAAGEDVAAQLKAAMRKNAFGDLRFSGRDPVEVIDELRTTWAEIGPILDEADRAQVARFEDVVAGVLDAAGAKATDREERSNDRGSDRDDSRRRRRRERNDAPPPMTDAEAASPVASTVASTPEAAPMIPSPRIETAPQFSRGTPPSTPIPVPTPAPAPVPSFDPIAPDAQATEPGFHPITRLPTIPAAAPSAAIDVHEAITRPAHVEMPADIPPVVSTPLPDPPVRAKPMSTAPPMDELDGGWDLGDDDPTAKKDEDSPSSAEMAGDGSVEGDGLDQVD